MSDRCVFLITGISAAGKSTVGQLLAERMDPSVHVKGDVYRRMIVNGRRHMRLRPDPEAIRQLELRYSLGAATADRYFEVGFNVVVQDIAMGSSLQFYVDAIASRPLHVVVLVPGVELVQAREAARPKTAYHPDGPTPADLDTFLRENTPHIGLWLDSSDLTPEQTVDEILSRLDEARV